MRPHFEVADVVRVHGEQYRRVHAPTAAQDKVLRHLAACRTAVLGGHVDECVDCGHQRISYNSCRDRHCPKCQAMQRLEWLEKRRERLLPVPYFHVVFTLPAELNALVLGNKKRLYGLLFEAAAKTLQQLAGDPKHLGAQLGFTAVLHTWGQNLSLHPHLHCVVTGGGLSKDGARWVPARKGYLLPVRVLGKLFRGKYLAQLHCAWKQGHLKLGGGTAQLADPVAWSALKDRLYRKDWVVYSKPPFGGTKQVFAYLGRYTHRVAITNHRLVDFSIGRVTFGIKDYADDGRRKTLTLDAVEFLRRFLLHVLPKGFVRIRHYGLYAGSNVSTRLATAHERLAPSRLSDEQQQAKPPLSASTPWWERLRERTGIDVMACPCCGGQLIRGQVLSAQDAQARAPPEAA